MTLYPAYSIQALQWKKLSMAAAHDSSSGIGTERNSSLNLAQSHLRTELQKQNWLLEEEQHISLPPTHLDDRTHIFSMGDFVTRADEAVAKDVEWTSVDENTGQRKKLTTEQLQQIQNTGQLDVPSALLEDQHHTWQVAPGFYSGSRPIRQSFQNGVGRALDHGIVYTQDSLFQNDDGNRRPTLHKSMVHGVGRAFRSVWEAIKQLLSCPLRHRKYSEDQIKRLIAEAEFGYVLNNLPEEADKRCLEIMRSYSLATCSDEASMLGEMWRELDQDAQWESLTYRPSSEDRASARRAVEQLAVLRKQFEAPMRSKRNQELHIDQAKALESPLAAIEHFDQAQNEWARAKDEAWVDHLLSQTIEETKKLGRAEVDRIMALKIEQDVYTLDSKYFDEQLEQYEDSLKKKRPILALSKAWKERKLEQERKKLEESLDRTRVDRVAQRLKSEDLALQGTARKLAAEFRRVHRDHLVNRLRTKISSLPPAKFEVLQLDPNNWTFGGGNSLKKYKTVEVDLDKKFWRARYNWMMVVAGTKWMIGSALQFLLSGPFSLRAFFSPRPYYAVTRPVRDERSLTPTLTSRLRSFYAALRAVRVRFDAAPDTGLIGKSIQSFFLRIYLAFKRTVGTLWIATFMTVGTITSTLLSFAVLILAPILAASFAVFSMVFNLVVYDTAIAAARGRSSGTDCETASSSSPVVRIALVMPYNLIVPGLLQAVLSLVSFAVIHPMIGIVTVTWTSLRSALRSLRDVFTWYFIRRYSRIPASDTFLAWRIHGPGLAQTMFYRLPVETAKVAVLLLLDMYRLQAHAKVRRCELDAPYYCYHNLFTNLLQPFGVTASLNVSPPSTVASRMMSKVRTPIEGMKREYHQQTREQVPSMAEHPLDIWDTLAKQIRSSHPDFELTRHAQRMRYQDNHSGTWGGTLWELDASLASRLEREYQKYKTGKVTELDEMVHRSGKLLAEMNLGMSIRERRLLRAVTVPPGAVGRFRMSADEQQQLWKFTMDVVSLYGSQIREELKEILETSEFSKELRHTVEYEIDSFYTSCSARPGQDIPIVAASLLRRLLGGCDMLETMGQTDEKLILTPKMSSEDEHLVFWRSFDLP